MTAVVLPAAMTFLSAPGRVAVARNTSPSLLMPPPPLSESPSCSGGSFSEGWQADVGAMCDIMKAQQAARDEQQATVLRRDSCAAEYDMVLHRGLGVLAQQRRDLLSHLQLAATRERALAPAESSDGAELSVSNDEAGDQEDSDAESSPPSARFGARTGGGSLVTSAAAAAPTPAQADPAAAPLKRQQRACVVMRAVLAAAPPVAAAPAAAPKPAKPRALAPKAAGIAKKATASKYPPPAAPVYGIGGSSPLAEDELVEFVIGIEPHSCDTNGRNKLGYSWAKFIRRAKDTDELPLWKLRICGPSSKVPRKTYERILENGELERIRAKIARGA